MLSYPYISMYEYIVRLCTMHNYTSMYLYVHPLNCTNVYLYTSMYLYVHSCKCTFVCNDCNAYPCICTMSHDDQIITLVSMKLMFITYVHLEPTYVEFFLYQSYFAQTKIIVHTHIKNYHIFKK